MFERFTDQARGVIVAATEEACALDSRHLGTEHLLLGLMHDPACVGGRAFASLGVSFDDARARIVSIVHDDTAAPSGSASLTPRAKKLLEVSGRQALRHGHAQISTGHLALALLRARDGTAVRVLSELGVERAAARTRVLEMLSTVVESTSRPTPGVGSHRQLSPQAQDFLRKALGVGSTYVARRYLPRFLRSASTTARVARKLGWQPPASSTNRSEPTSSAAAPSTPNPQARDPQHAPVPPTLPPTPATCSVCGRRSPDCGTLYTSAHGALTCEHCVGRPDENRPPQVTQ
jgi:hypothetical protein